MSDHKLKTLTITGILTALIFVFTAYIHIPSFNGYVHIGDGLLYLAAAILPTPYAMFAGAVGAVLADCLTGYAIWAPASFVIKLLTVLFFSAKGNRIIGKRNLLALLPAALLCLCGYYGFSFPFPEEESPHYCCGSSLRSAACSPGRQQAGLPSAFSLPRPAGLEKGPCSRRRHCPEFQHLNPSRCGCPGSPCPCRIQASGK